jgi:medium-chain acyl-[acyl-carrier-protein] hydrolase
MSDSTGRVTLLTLGARSAAQRRLFCVPFAGGGVSMFAPWWRELPADLDVVGVQLPGREARLREPLLTSIGAMAAAAYRAIQPVREQPYALFGHSMGALVAFELARLLERDGGASPSRLFVSSRRAPDEPDPMPPVQHLPDATFIAQLQSRFGAIPDAVLQDQELLAMMLPVLRADVTAVEDYCAEPGAVVRCPISAYGGADDTSPSPAQLHGWSRMTSAACRVQTFAGGHFYVSAQRSALLADVARALD